jgi:hypothetical protein
MMLEPGKLYRINRLFWLLFPTEMAAALASLPSATSQPRPGLRAAHYVGAVSWSSRWAKELNRHVSFLSEGDVIMAVKVSGKHVQVINQEGKGGWINFPTDQDWTRGAITEAFNAY